ncbi:MAG: hypothetical protein BWY11_00132 [Firmicutes bacterium ADurb.Bin182]|nr:MAG: hypothetical protein BWY11_00132 [Firmicutes bacterium ADurb.Bin182]
MLRRAIVEPKHGNSCFSTCTSTKRFPLSCRRCGRIKKFVKLSDMCGEFYSFHGRCPENSAEFLSDRVKTNSKFAHSTAVLCAKYRRYHDRPTNL